MAIAKPNGSANQGSILGGKTPSIIFVVRANMWPVARIPTSRPTNHTECAADDQRRLQAPETCSGHERKRNESCQRGDNREPIVSVEEFLQHRPPLREFAKICERGTRGRSLAICTDEQVRETGDTAPATSLDGRTRPRIRLTVRISFGPRRTDIFRSEIAGPLTTLHNRLTRRKRRSRSDVSEER